MGSRRCLSRHAGAALLAAAVVLAVPSHAARRDAGSAAARTDPEVMLIEVYKELAANRLASAQARAEALVNAYPNFHLGQLIYGDLLQMHTRPVDTLGAVGNAPAERLADLREEAMVRLRSLRERPAPDLMPRPLLQLRDDQKHALVVDAKRSRLYVYENRGGELKFVSDYYISQGKLGVNKLKEGDQKTPVGVYYITRRLPGVRLPDFYGPGALPINYPNEWDRLNGRSGSGIWLHGTPSDSYSRPPLSSDGCVVLTNPDLKKLTASVEIGKTPVVIAENIEFVNRAKWASERELAAGLVDQWRRDLEGQDAGKLALHYSSQFKSDRGEDFAGWYARKQLPAFNPRGFSVKLRDATHFLYPGRGDMIVSTFTQEVTAGKFRHTARKRQYWSREGGQWRIVHEAEI